MWITMDEARTMVKTGVKMNNNVNEYVKKGIAVIFENGDGSCTVTYKGTNRGAYLSLNDIQACACRVLEQLMNSVSYEVMMKK